MADYDHDLFVIGAGSGGVRAARMSAGFGARVVVAENRYLGGTCVNVGCVPKKLFVYASGFSEEFRDAGRYGWRLAEWSFDWKRLLVNKNREIERLQGVYQKLLARAGVAIISGRARIVDPHTVTVGRDRYTAKRILVATGGWPMMPDLPGTEHVITSNEAFHLEELPGRIVIVGGGYIAVEFAGIFHGLGVDTTLLYRGPLFLRGFDHDIRSFLADEMRKKGINLQFDAKVAEVKKAGDGLTVVLAEAPEIDTDLVMYAIGRRPNTAGLGLEEIGVALTASGAVIVDDQYQTSVPSIYALGDVTHRINLTPVALAEGMALATDLYGGASTRVDYENIPTTVFSQPNLGTVGLTEAMARDRYSEIDVYRSIFTPLKHTLTGSQEQTMTKLIVQRTTDRVVGAHMVGADAGEIVQALAIAIRAGATKTIVDSTIGVHPTLAEEFVTMREPLN